jgi:two-component system response regulator HydG
LGETGTGKEYISMRIHQKSERRNGPFIAIDCGSLSKELAGSELFGHVKGAFTGALDNKTGYFEYAKGGTIFLDEIGNLGYETQVKLLRALQERKIRKIGGNRTGKGGNIQRRPLSSVK